MSESTDRLVEEIGLIPGYISRQCSLIRSIDLECSHIEDEILKLDEDDYNDLEKILDLRKKATLLHFEKVSAADQLIVIIIEESQILNKEIKKMIYKDKYRMVENYANRFNISSISSHDDQELDMNTITTPSPKQPLTINRNINSPRNFNQDIKKVRLRKCSGSEVSNNQFNLQKDQSPIQQHNNWQNQSDTIINPKSCTVCLLDRPRSQWVICYVCQLWFHDDCVDSGPPPLHLPLCQLCKESQLHQKRTRFHNTENLGRS